MKLKYYLRGLAVGVILTTIILSIANADNRPLTDAQIRMRALELGMVEGESIKLSDVAESGSDSSSAEPESVEKESMEPSVQQSASDEPESVSSDASSADEAGSTAASVDGAGSASKPPVSESIEPTEPTESVSFTIKSGESSYTVSKALAAAGLVEDAQEFDDYLCNNGYSRKIRTGTYEIVPGMTYEEIAKKIAN